VEGQGEYLIVHALARALSYDLDEYGVSVIDAVNNGHPAAFAALARALGIPWIAVLDGDAAGQDYVESIIRRGFDAAAISQRCRTLPGGNLEQQLLADGLEPELRTTLQNLDVPNALSMDRQTLERWLDSNKTRYAAELAKQITANTTLAQRMPQAFRDAITALRGLT
jgi:putative ATP-dependent endonuclease of OLD family